MGVGRGDAELHPTAGRLEECRRGLHPRAGSQAPTGRPDGTSPKLNPRRTRRNEWVFLRAPSWLSLFGISLTAAAAPASGWECYRSLLHAHSPLACIRRSRADRPGPLAFRRPEHIAKHTRRSPSPIRRNRLDVGSVLFSKEALKFVHSGAGLLPVTMYRLPVNLAGASGPIGGLYCGLPSICSCQFDSAPEVSACLFGTIALA